MKFEEVLPALRKGIKVRRKSWNKRNYIVVKKDNLIVDENDYAIPFCIDDFSADDWEIIKEKKKVKLRDLTEEQLEKWVLKNCGNYNDKCDGCPFQKVYCDRNPNIDDLWISSKDLWWIRNKDLYSDKFLDQEVEIDE